MKKLLRLFPLLLVMALPIGSRANNVVITNTTFNDATDVLSFTLSWENSWRISAGPANWDAVWIFIKYQNCPDLTWNHLNLSAAGHSTGTPALLEVQVLGGAPYVGVFVRRTATGSGNIPATTINLQTPATAGNGAWNYRVFGVEMVYVPSSSFQIGDGTSTSTFISQSIASDGAVASGTLIAGGVAVPAAYPMAFDGYYMMKYDVSTEMYANYLNTLTYDQQQARITCNANDPVGTLAYAALVRLRIEISQVGVNNTTPAVFACDANNNNTFNENNDGQWSGMNGISWLDQLAFLDWSGLRPASEIEYEKACRGTLARVAGEFAWGNTTATLERPGSEGTSPLTANETFAAAGTAVGPLNYISTQGSWRNGFAANSSTNRTTAGATYYGIMEMSGNLWKVCVAATTTDGANFVPNHGDGTLTAGGLSDVAGWPITATSFGYRGGAHDSGATAPCRISDRSSATTGAAGGTTRNGNCGIRGVRTYP